MTLYIKNMVCNRCVSAVQQLLEKHGFSAAKISLGEVILKEDVLKLEKLTQLDKDLVTLGFERIDDRQTRLIEGIKNKVIQMIHHSKQLDRKFNWSKILADEMHYDYNYLSNLFSSIEGITLEQYIIRQKIEKVKELLLYDEMNLSEIARVLGYSNGAHLSSQFKKVTGFTPSQLKKAPFLNHHRKSIDKIN